MNESNKEIIQSVQLKSWDSTGSHQSVTISIQENHSLCLCLSILVSYSCICLDYRNVWHIVCSNKEMFSNLVFYSIFFVGKTEISCV